MEVVVYLLLAVVGLTYFWFVRRFRYWTDRGFLCPQRHIPFGSFKGVGTKLPWFQAIDKVYREFKGKASAVGFFVFAGPNVLPMDPELIKNILVRDFNSFQDRGFYHNKEDDPISVNMLSLDGQEWRERRTKLSPMFTSGKMKMMFEIVVSKADKLVAILENNFDSSTPLNIREWVGKFTTDVIGNVAFGLDCNCLEDENSVFYKQTKNISDLSTFQFLKFFFATNFQNLARKLHIEAIPKEPADFLMNTFLKTVEYREKNNIKRNDFISLLLGLREYFTLKELAGESFLVFVGGSDTSAILTTFTCYELALNPEIQERLRDELLAVVEKNDGKLTYEMLFGFKYLDMVINESLRKYPPIPASLRKSTKDYTIPGTSLTIPKGVRIHIPTFSLHRDPEHYPEPEKFDPERFNEENSKNRNPFTFLPFAEGPRNCIGMRFGLMQSKIAVAKLVMNFKISPSEKIQKTIVFEPSQVFLNEVGGTWLKFDKIKN